VETLFLIIDTVAILLVLVFSMKNDRLRPGTPEMGLFRIAAEPAEPKPERPARRPVF
jgi:hypothetical protein